MIELTYSAAETAKMLGISIKTLREHVRHGRIRSIKVGTGKKRPRRRFTEKNMQSFIENQKVREVPPCQSTKPPKAHSTNTTSKSTVIAFTALQKPKASAMQKPSNASSGTKPARN